MKALQYYAPGDLRLVDIPRPQCHPNTMIVKILACAICGTDLKIWKVGNPRITPPNVIGHELAGEIVEIGAAVKGFRIGERITLATTIACGECYLCREDHINLCPNAKPISYDYPGAFAEYMEVPASAIRNGNAVKLPADVDEDAAALAEPLSCVINSQRICDVKTGDSILVVGAGPLGCLHIECAKAFGATTVVVCAHSENRRALAKQLGVTAAVDRSKRGYQDELMRITENRGFDTVIVTVPVAEVQEESLNYAKKGGGVNLFASLPKGCSMLKIDSRLIHYNELRLTGASDSSPRDVREAVDLIAQGKINSNIIITHRFPLDRIFDGLRLMENREGLKIIIKPWLKDEI